MGTIISLTTDFGWRDAYLAAIKGTILGINPEVTLVDICHTIEAQNILETAFVLKTACDYFPPDTIHLVVVDPGVGTERRAIILRTPTACFVAPDNGVLSYVIPNHLCRPPLDNTAKQVALEAGFKAVNITNPQFWQTPPSTTFHGRDIFAPVAAHLSLGIPLTEFGEEISSVTLLPLPQPYREADGTLAGQVLYIDSFGNLITSIKSGDLPGSGALIKVVIGNHVIQGLNRTYATGEGLIALIGSSGYLEIALPGGSAGKFTGSIAGSRVKVRW